VAIKNFLKKPVVFERTENRNLHKRNFLKYIFFSLMSNGNQQIMPWWAGKKGELLVVLQFLLLVVFITVPAWNPMITGQDEAVTIAGFFLAAIFWGIALILGAGGSFHLRKYVTPLPYPVDHSRLVRHGVYALVRHPLYSSQLFAALGWCIHTLSLSHMAILIAAFFFFDYKASKEEQWLTQRHPDYAEYAARVKKLVPWVY
jgi:protein-S-isoprenylcysteine O-methyltransferase Ste14